MNLFSTVYSAFAVVPFNYTDFGSVQERQEVAEQGLGEIWRALTQGFDALGALLRSLNSGLNFGLILSDVLPTVLYSFILLVCSYMVIRFIITVGGSGGA